MTFGSLQKELNGFRRGVGVGKVTGVGGLFAAAARRGIPKSVEATVDPKKLRWSQPTAGGKGRTGKWRQRMEEEGGWVGDPIDVVRTPDGLVTVDHTRAALALEMNIAKIPVRIHSANARLPSSMVKRGWNRAGDTAKTWGEAVKIRAEGQTPRIPATGRTKPPKLR